MRESGQRALSPLTRYREGRDEERFLLIGRSYRLRVLLICHCLRGREGVIRIISARRATAKERAVYHGGRS